MSLTLEQLGTYMDTLAHQVEVSMGNIVRKAATTAVRYLVRDTPVDTGLARSNWIVSSGSFDESTVGIREPDATIEAAVSVISQAKLDQPLIVQNNIDYIELLNEGSSRQAPANFAEAAVLAAIATIDTAKVVD